MNGQEDEEVKWKEERGKREGRLRVKNYILFLCGRKKHKEGGDSKGGVGIFPIFLSTSLVNHLSTRAGNFKHIFKEKCY